MFIKKFRENFSSVRVQTIAHGLPEVTVEHWNATSIPKAVQSNAHELRQHLNWDSGKPCGQKMQVHFCIHFVDDKIAELSRKCD